MLKESIRDTIVKSIKPTHQRHDKNRYPNLHFETVPKKYVYIFTCRLQETNAYERYNTIISEGYEVFKNLEIIIFI